MSLGALASALKAGVRAAAAALAAVTTSPKQGGHNDGGNADDGGAAAVVSAAESSYAVQLQRDADGLRNTAQWLLATLGAIAVVLVAGLQFKSIGGVPGGWRAAASVGGATIGIVGVTIVIWFLLKIMLPSEVTIADLAQGRASELRKYLEQNPDALQGYADVSALHNAYIEAMKRANSETLAYYEALRATGSEENPEAKSASLRAKLENAQLTFVGAKVGYITKLLAVKQLQSRFGFRQRLIVFLAAAAIGAGIGLFAWGTNSPKAKPEQSIVNLSGANLSGAGLRRGDLPGGNLRGARMVDADLVGANLSGADLTDANLRGATLTGATVTKVIWANTTCPDGTNSDRHMSTCKGHLIPPKTKAKQRRKRTS